MRRVIVMTAVLTAALALPAAAGASGKAVPLCNRLPATIVGTAGDDVLMGTPGDDVIFGGAGNDEIHGRGGDDTICGSLGDDLLYGDAGDDVIKAGSGDDTVYGGTGDDLLAGWTGNDTLVGYHGRDRILGHAGADKLVGGNQDDVLLGGAGTDVVKGNAGVDECDGETLTRCEKVDLQRGDRGYSVRYLQRTLANRALYRGPIDGVFDREVAIAVATFHKVTGPAYTNPNTAVARWQANPPSEEMRRSEWDGLLAFSPAPPKVRMGQPDRVEVDIGHQALYLILDDEVDAIVHVSTGHNPDDTPRTTRLADGGYFWYKHPYDGWSPKPGAWSIYKFWAYRAGREYNYGVHGYRDVPYYPASHGCTRVHVWEADYLAERFFIRMPVHVWDA